MAQIEQEEFHPSSRPTSEGDENELEDTKPRRLGSKLPGAEQSAVDDQLAATTQTSIEKAVDPAEDAANLAQTQLVEAGLSQTQPNQTGKLDPDDEQLSGFEHTIPPPPGAADLSLEAENSLTTAVIPPRSVETPLTQSTASSSPIRKKKQTTSKAMRRKRWNTILIPVIGLATILMIAGISAFGGYASGIGMRRDAQSTQVVQAAEQQFQLALQDMSESNYYRARQRLEYVIQMNPNFPGATDKLAEVLLYLNATATPTLAATPTLTPTPDTRANEDLFNQANQAILNSDWDTAVDSLLSLRQKDINYRPVEIDGLLFLALRNRGKEKIVSTNLESGIYDLTLAKNFGPLDSESSGLLTWSQLYITGASFWEIDWAQVIEYFSQVAPQMPNLTDSSGMTASERYRQGLYQYGNQLAQGGQFCRAVQLYAQSLEIAHNVEVQTAWEQAVKGCDGGGGDAQQTPKPGGKKKTPTAGPPAP